MDTHSVTPPTDSMLLPCELGDLEPPCEVCDGTGEVLDAPGRGGRAILPCLDCDAYDLQQELLADQYTESRKD